VSSGMLSLVALVRTDVSDEVPTDARFEDSSQRASVAIYSSRSTAQAVHLDQLLQ
jgi:hypothetical protein